MASRRALSVITCLHKQSHFAAVLQTSGSDVSRVAACGYATTSLKPKPQAAPKYKLVVVGGGSGGCAVAAKFKELGRDVCVIEPSDLHYYQPIWTLVGAGLKGFQSSVHPTRDVLPHTCEWIRDRAVKFDPQNNTVETASEQKIRYEYLVVAMGIQLDFDKVKGLQDALVNDPQVVSNYHPKWVNKTFPAMQQFKGGNAIFTFPNTPIKCAGAPQKIMYLADEFFRTTDVRDKSSVIFNTSLGVIFGVKKYADALLKVVAKRDIKVNYKHSLTEVDHKSRTATFAKLDEDSKPVPFKYDFLHVTPPMSAPDVLKSSLLVNDDGWVDVHKHTLQHKTYKNVFALGDCTSLPTSKTGAAVASQAGILHKNLQDAMNGKPSTPLYDGYTSCPLITSSKTCILAEFDYDGNPLETFPFNQGKERNITYAMKAHVMPPLYWKMMTRGKWNGPSLLRKIMHLGMSKSKKLQA